jgi:hypothetical protein
VARAVAPVGDLRLTRSPRRLLRSGQLTVPQVRAALGSSAIPIPMRRVQLEEHVASIAARDPLLVDHPPRVSFGDQQVGNAAGPVTRTQSADGDRVGQRVLAQRRLDGAVAPLLELVQPTVEGDVGVDRAPSGGTTCWRASPARTPRS